MLNATPAFYSLLMSILYYHGYGPVTGYISVTVHGRVEGQNYRGFDIAQRVGIPCGAGLQLAWSPLRERLL